MFQEEKSMQTYKGEGKQTFSEEETVSKAEVQGIQDWIKCVAIEKVHQDLKIEDLACSVKEINLIL